MPVFNFLLPWSRSSLFLSSSIHAALPQLPPDSISPLVGLTLVLTCSLLSYCHLPPSLPPLFPTTYLTLILISSSFSPSLPLRWTLVGPQRSSSLQCRVSEGCSFLPLQEAPLVISSPLPASHSQPDVLLDIHIDILHTQELPVLMCWYGTSSSIISPGATFGYFAMGWCWWEFLSSGMVTFRKLNFAPKRDFIFILTWKVTKPLGVFALIILVLLKTDMSMGWSDCEWSTYKNLSLARSQSEGRGPLVDRSNNRNWIWN